MGDRVTRALRYVRLQWTRNGREWPGSDRRAQPSLPATATGGLKTTRSVMRATRIITASLAAVLAAGALAGPATARIDPPLGRPDLAPPTLTPTPQPNADAPRSGFDWGSAGIGAAAGVGAFAIALAGTAGMRRRTVAPHRSITTR
jgi:hypothetical protein